MLPHANLHTLCMAVFFPHMVLCEKYCMVCFTTAPSGTLGAPNHPLFSNQQDYVDIQRNNRTSSADVSDCCFGTVVPYTVLYIRYARMCRNYRQVIRLDINHSLVHSRIFWRALLCTNPFC